MGYLDHLSNLCTVNTRKSKNKVMQVDTLFLLLLLLLLLLLRGFIGWLTCSSPTTVEIKVKMDCDGCERRVKHAVSSMKGVKSVDVNRKQSRVMVSGYVKPNKVLERVKSTGKRAEFWPYVPYNLVYYPYVPQAYDKKAPSGFVKNVAQALPSPNAPVERLTALFSDENPNACTIM
ncbi:heavy metal-associated isoprenylated plant protein 21-like isoform X3 [Diospyros lotus]|uniref:heavy metal-associated isoprenylated plant protein 21-like isoform X3 n=1 Tax=Diospyros lotus TaxID=55363 RepID=UPI00224EDFE1|nr:heavy metal-associated isoprenylated plant protein 21-like isoform X3 [Diospyros lotus]